MSFYGFGGGGGIGAALVAPVIGDLATSVNWGTSTDVTNNGVLKIVAQMAVGPTLRMKLRSIITLEGSYVEWISSQVNILGTGAVAGFPCAMRESGTGKIVSFGMISLPGSTTMGLYAIQWNDENTAVGVIGTPTQFGLARDVLGWPLRFRMENVGTNLLLKVSVDGGGTFDTISTLAHGTYGTPNQFGIAVQIQDNTADPIGAYAHLKFNGA